MRILFCGHGFPAAPRMLAQRLVHDQVEVCADGQVLEAAAQADVIIPAMARIDRQVMEASPVRLIQQWGTGLDGVDLEAARQRGVWVANVPSDATHNAGSVAELAMLFILALIRGLPQAQANVRAGRLGEPLGRTLAQCTICLFGLGNIALGLAQRLHPSGARLIGISRHPDNVPAELGLSACFATQDRLSALAQSDVVVLCLPLTDQTRGIMGQAELAALPQGAHLINVGRGPLVDYQALLEALKSGHLGGAGLDVYWKEPLDPKDPLLAFPNLIATPHIGGLTEQSYQDLMEGVVANIERLRQGLPPLNRAA